MQPNIVTLGSDPELFAIKAQPHRLVELGLDSSLVESTIPSVFFGTEHTLPHGTLTNDGLALEFTVNPTKDIEEIVDRIRQNIRRTYEIVASIVDGTLSVIPTAYVAQQFIDMLPEDKYGKKSSLQVLGCDPDYNVYGLDIPAKPNPKQHNYRTSGGHIHIEMGKEFVHDQAAVAFLTAILDQTIGAAGTILCNSKEAQERLKMYGWAGMVRTNREIGTVEYRTLPAQALIQTPDLAYMMFATASHIGTWAKTIYCNNQPDFIHAAEELIGGYDDAVRGAWSVIKHDIPECRAILERSSAFFNTPVLKDLLIYQIPDHFELEGWW